MDSFTRSLKHRHYLHADRYATLTQPTTLLEKMTPEQVQAHRARLHAGRDTAPALTR